MDFNIILQYNAMRHHNFCDNNTIEKNRTMIWKNKKNAKDTKLKIKTSIRIVKSECDRCGKKISDGKR